MKHLILLCLLFYLASCVEGEQKVIVSTDEAAKPPSLFPIEQRTTEGSPPALPIPSNFAFTQIYCNGIYCPQNQYPFLQNTRATLEVQITNPSNLQFSVEWSVALNNEVPEVLQVDNDQPISNYSIGMGNPKFSSLGFYTIVSSLKDSDGLLISNLVWSVEVVGDKPSYASFSPSPSPTPYVGSPFSASNSTPQTISAIISNPSVIPLNNFWYLDGVLQGTFTDHTVTNVSFSFTPSSMSIGNHTVVAQLTDNPATGTIYNTATWSFEVTELPQFSTFSNPQLPSPALFPDVEFGVGNPDILLDPNPLYNPSAASFTVYWELDGAIDASATFNGGPGNDDPPPYIIDPDDPGQFGVGRHSVVAILYDNSGSTPTLVDSASWNFEIVFPPPAVLTEISPATTTQIFSVINIPMDGTSPMGGFFQGPESPTSRGTPMVVSLPDSSTDTFCLNVSDGRGIGFGYAPTSAGVLIQYETASSTPINPVQLQFAQSASPTAVCLDGKGAINFADGVPNFSLSALGDTFITAIVTDKLSLQEIARVQWNIRVNDLNTIPTLAASAPFSTSTVGDVVQDATYTFSFIVEDQDCSPSLSTLNCYSSTFSLVSPAGNYILDGVNGYYGTLPPLPPTPLTPNCVRDYNYPGGADKFDCEIIIPSNNGTGPMPSTGTYQVTAQVDNLSIWNNPPAIYVGPPDYFDPMEQSSVLTWNLNVLEVNNGTPTLENIITSGAADPSTNSYVYLTNPSVPNVAADFAVEGDTVMFNLNVDDPEKDNYRVEIFYNTSASPTVYQPIPGYATSTVYPISNIPIDIAPFQLPFTLASGVATATINLRVVLTDVPDTSTPLTSIPPYDFPITVTNVNPIPEVVATSERPATNTTGVVMQGFPYTMSADIIDGSTPGEGDGLIWQWMVNQNGAAECASQTASSWKNIKGATQGTAPLQQPQTASLTWSPPSTQISGIPPSTTFCFRNCIADNEFPPLNTLDCSPTMAGPWVGGILGSPADINDVDLGGLDPVRGDTAVWADPGNDGDVYGIRVSGNKIFIYKYIYNLDTTVTQSGTRTTTWEGVPETASITEGAYDLSMTGNNQYIFVSYVFNNPYFPPFEYVPTNMVLRILKDFSDIDYFINDKIPAGVGQIVANDSAFWVPYINSGVGDTPFVFAGNGTPGATTTINESFSNGSFPIPDSVAAIQSREQNGELFMALKLDDGTVDLYQYTLGALSTPTFKASDLDIFSNYYVPFSDMSLAVGTPTNPNVFVAGIDTSTKALFYGIKPIADILSNNLPFTVPNISSATAIYPATFDPKGLNAVATTKAGEVLLGFLNASATARSPFADLYILKSDGTNLKLSSRINQNRIDIPSPRIYTSDDFALTKVSPKFQIGSAGAVATENQKDTIWFRYWDYSTARMVIINIENETFSSGTPTEGAGDAWSEPWFEQ